MKNLFNCSSLIRVAVIIVVMAFVVPQVTETDVQGNDGPPGGGPTGGVPGEFSEINAKLDEISNKLDCVGICSDPGECPGAVPKTGQTSSTDNRDDGELKRGVAWPNPRFTDNGNGTITDNLTCLIWDKDANRFGGLREWAEALSDCNGLEDNGDDLTDGSSAGDWQLPNLFELESILHMGVFDPAVPDTSGTGKWSQGDPFNDVQSSFYWSSTTFAPATINAWNVLFVNGLVWTSTLRPTTVRPASSTYGVYEEGRDG